MRKDTAARGKMAEEHDKTHRLIFFFPRIIADMIRLLLGGDWVERLDFSTLEKVPERLLSPELLRREQDVLWRVAYSCPEEEKLDWFFFYLHIEHQSNPRPKMSLFTSGYKLLAWQDLLRRDALVPDNKLPPILSLVFYTGERVWKVATSLSDEVKTLPEAPDGTDPWSYRLIDVKRYPLQEILGEDSPLVGILQLAQAKSFEDLPGPAKAISDLLGPEDYELRQAVVTMINEEICPKLADDGEEPPRITDLEEFPTMMEQTMDSIIHRLRMEGEARGKAEGEARGEARGKVEGKAEGEANLFKELFVARYGDLPGWVRERIAAAKKGQLVTWAKRLLTSQRPEDVFEQE
ncbi:MAG: Rpn family recombination-promoting nuclease/putative transposase [Myxococcales bacterium]|nr:Rpn family recombination-promoting nuclease/putative transposase [Myxococcales bacterium]